MNFCRVALMLAAFGIFGIPLRLSAGGSGLNLAIVVNQNNTNSVQLGNYYREMRQVPPENLLRINWAGDNVAWNLGDYTQTLLNPLLAMLADRQLTNQIDYIVLSMDIPYRVLLAGSEENSTTSALSYGFKPDPNPPCSLAGGSTSAYAGSEGIFRNTPPLNPGSNSYLVTMITASNLAAAKRIIDQGVASDQTFPTQTVILGKSGDIARNVRFFAFDNAVFNTRLRGNYAMIRTNISEPGPNANLLGYQNGTVFFNLLTNTFVPGAMADNLTSFGGQIFQNAGQTSELGFFSGGAAGSYGTVTEPCNYPQKFPDPQNYFYQSRGFNLAECYYLSVTNPYQGLTMGEPLAAPFAKQGQAHWMAVTNNAVVTSSSLLSAQFVPADSGRPLQQVDLFVDGFWRRTITNVAPQAGNVLEVSINGTQIDYLVKNGDTLLSMASGMAQQINQTQIPGTGVIAIPHGDRVELQWTNSSGQISPTISVSARQGTGASLTSEITANRSQFLDSIAWGLKSFEIGTNVDNSSFLQLNVTKTNGAVVTISITNSPGNSSLMSFVQQFTSAINNSPALQGADGLVLEDLQDGDPGTVFFDLRARGQGLAAAQIQVQLAGSTNLGFLQSSNRSLTDNISDLWPRYHFYLGAGVTNTLLATFPLGAMSDGYHDLTVVAYEGTHVRTQTRATTSVVFSETTLKGTLNALVGGTNTAVESVLQFQVTANTNVIQSIELFGTGGSLGMVSNQSVATFSLAAAQFGLGLHPFFAIITDAAGWQYRTETLNFRIIGLDKPFTLQIGSPPPTLAWPAAAGRNYDVLSASRVEGPYLVRQTITATNSLAQWAETNGVAAQLFYRVRVSP